MYLKFAENWFMRGRVVEFLDPPLESAGSCSIIMLLRERPTYDYYFLALICM